MPANPYRPKRRTRRPLRILAPAFVMVIAAGCVTPPAPGDEVASASIADVGAIFNDTISNPVTPAAIDRLWAALMENDACSDDGARCLIGGDIYFDRDEAIEFLTERRELLLGKKREIDEGENANELARNLIRGAGDFWPRGQRNITYAVRKKSGPDDERGFGAVRYEKVVRYMEEAATQWETACREECGWLDFRHVPEFDNNPTHANVTFIVQADKKNKKAARSFYPHQWKNEARRASSAFLTIFSGFFEGDGDYLKFAMKIADNDIWHTEISRSGILRHELGHILGYRHEFLLFEGTDGFGKCRNTIENPVEGEELATASELLQWTALQAVAEKADADSVMMYPCSDKHKRERLPRLEMKLSERDKNFHVFLYGGK